MTPQQCNEYGAQAVMLDDLPDNPAQKRPLVVELVSRIQAARACQKSGNSEWEKKHHDVVRQLEEYLPSGSGFDSGSIVDLGSTTDTKLVIHTSYHHMGENGMCLAWTDHQVIVTPSFRGIDIRITGKNRNDIKDYIAEVFYDALQRCDYSFT